MIFQKITSPQLFTKKNNCFENKAMSRRFNTHHLKKSYNILKTA